MIDWILDNAFGSWGGGLFDFYFANALPINLVVIAYGVALAYWHLALRPYRRAAIDQVSRIISSAGKPGSGPKLYAYVGPKIKWEQVASVGVGKLVAGRWGLWPVKVTAERLRKILPVSELCRDAIAERQQKAKPRLGKFEE